MVRIQSGGGEAPFGSEYSDGLRTSCFKASRSNAEQTKPIMGEKSSDLPIFSACCQSTPLVAPLVSRQGECRNAPLSRPHIQRRSGLRFFRPSHKPQMMVRNFGGSSDW